MKSKLRREINPSLQCFLFSETKIRELSYQSAEIGICYALCPAGYTAN